MEGAIRLDMSVLKNTWASDPETFSAWVRILLFACSEDTHWNGKMIPRGSLVTSIRSLSELCSVSVKKMRIILERLLEGHMIGIQTSRNYTVISVCKYDAYCESVNDEGTLGAQQRHTQGTPVQDPKKERTKEKTESEESMYISDDIHILKKDEPEPLGVYCDFWNSICPDLPRVQMLGAARQLKLRQRIAEMEACTGLEALEVFRTCCQKICASDFTMGRTGNWNGASFDWLIDNDLNWMKVYEGQYDNRKSRTKPTKMDMYTQYAIDNFL